MNKFEFNTKLALGYSSNSQIARVLTENWVKENSYCPCCGEVPLNEFENNKPVADFYCKKFSEEFELKIKNGKFSTKISDGAYYTIIERINSNQNPNFLKDWNLDLMTCVDLIKKEAFTLEDISKFEDKLKLKYPSNNFIKDKIRQQLQVLRGKGIIELISRGYYKKIKYGNI